MAHQFEFQNFNLIWQYFTMKERSLAKCKICCQDYDSNNEVRHLKNHLKLWHSHVIEEIKEVIKSTWLSLYFAFDIEYDSIRCIFCEKDIDIFHGMKYLKYHMNIHNVNEFTTNFLKHDDATMQKYLPAKIYEKIIQKVQDEITSTGLSLYFVLNGYTKMECVICDFVVNILNEKQILRDHLFSCHNIIVENNVSTSAVGATVSTKSQTPKKFKKSQDFEIIKSLSTSNTSNCGSDWHV